MTRQVLPALPLVAVTWDDAQSSSGEVIDDVTIAANHQPKVVVTLGWLMRDDAAGVSVCSEHVSGIGYRGHTFVPRSLVRSVRVLRKARKS
jgi:hypothetical protein